MADGNLIVGTQPDKLPASGQLGGMAFQDPAGMATVAPIGCRVYAFADRPPAANYQYVAAHRLAWTWIMTSAGRPRPCWSDGTNWIDVVTDLPIA